MLKFLIILILISYVLYKVGGFIFKMFAIGATENRQTTSGRRKAANSNLDIDYEPPKPKEKDDFKGGDYIDYEEVK